MTTLTLPGLEYPVPGDTGPVRVLVTGSRYWASPDLIGNAFAVVAAEHPGRRIVVVHGQCDPRSRFGRHPRIPWQAAGRMDDGRQLELLGADWLADRLALRLGWEREPDPANWYPGGGGGAIVARDDAAGFKRNRRMVTRGAHVCLAFVLRCRAPGCRGERPHGSHGTAHCMRHAGAAGIPVRPHGWRVAA